MGSFPDWSTFLNYPDDFHTVTNITIATTWIYINAKAFKHISYSAKHWYQNTMYNVLNPIYNFTLNGAVSLWPKWWAMFTSVSKDCLSECIVRFRFDKSAQKLRTWSQYTYPSTLDHNTRSKMAPFLHQQKI